MTDSSPSISAPSSSRSVDDVFPDLRKLFDSSKASIQLIEEDDYLIDSSFRESYQRYNANTARYVRLEFHSYSVSFWRSEGAAVVVASLPFRKIPDTVPYYRALLRYYDCLCNCLQNCSLSLTTRKRLNDYLESARKSFDKAREDSDDGTGLRNLIESYSHLLPEFEGEIRALYNEFSESDAATAAKRILRFMLDYTYWEGGKSLARKNDFYFSPILALLGIAQASGEIYGPIVRDFSDDYSLCEAARHLKPAHTHDDGNQRISDEPAERLKTGANIMIYGAPGTGKSWFIENELYKNAKLTRTVFHPEYSYFDFVGSYKPVPAYVETDARILDSSAVVSGIPGMPSIDYRFVPGPFVDAVVDAYEHPLREDCLVIEEINRASAAAVFGDMFQLLDRNSEHESDYAIKPQPELAKYLRSIGHDELASAFLIPSNLSIVATMNNADLGVTYLDTAFKRRWSFTYIPVELNKNTALYNEVAYNGSSFPLLRILGAINEKLRGLRINEDRWVGPFFVAPQEIETRGTKEALKKIVMYLWDDVFRNDRAAFFDPKTSSLSAVERTLDEGDPLLIVETIDSMAADDDSGAAVEETDSQEDTLEA
ncbi:hypothetical protein B5F74_02290 [Collinsella sp. An271]|uniref:AAA family ATPase n=1 Tax=Collinsella sp. An271 TaxID=1965616 RepID=UPI000B389890|nr:AAA family ATPase [Collinsella sp. An271]OUO62061.1 hypothetical protein B5F74_02290 [Collinsella sp. An271]